MVRLKNYTNLWMKNGSKITTSKKLKVIEGSLPNRYFFVFTTLYIVNLQYVKKYHKRRGGYLVLLDGQPLPVSSAPKGDFIN